MFTPKLFMGVMFLIPHSKFHLRWVRKLRTLRTMLRVPTRGPQATDLSLCYRQFRNPESPRMAH